jgi:hypothetical protein
MRSVSGHIVLLLGMLMLVKAAAAATQFEVEPNDTPVTATPVRGPVTLAGRLPGPDQDGYRWTVTDTDAASAWTLTLHGVPGRLTVVDILRVDSTADGKAVTGREKLLTIGSRDGAKPVSAEALVLEPGEYLLGVAHGGGGAKVGAGADAGSLGGPFRPPTERAGFGDAAPPQPSSAGDDGYRLQLIEAGPLWLKNVANEPEDKKTPLR